MRHELAIAVLFGFSVGVLFASAYFIVDFLRQLRRIRRSSCHCGRAPHAVVTVMRLSDGSVYSQAPICEPCHGWYAAHDADAAPPWRDARR